MRRNRYARLALNLALSSVLPLIVMVSGLGLLFKLTNPVRTPVSTAQLKLPERMPLVIPWICRDMDRLNRLRQNWPLIGIEPYKDLMYVEGDVLITGHEAHVGAVLKLLDPQQKPRPALFARRSPPDEQMAQQQQADYERVPLGNQRAIYRYQVNKPVSPNATDLSAADYGPVDNRSVVQLTCTVNVLRNLYRLEISAEPNYHLSPAGWAGGGSPWTQNGGGWVDGLEGGGLAAAKPEEFKTQWALTSDGIGLFDDSQERQVDSTGASVRIGIFDTSPFGDRLGENGRCENCTLQNLGMVAEEDVPADFADMRLTVWHDEMDPTTNCPGWDRHKTKEDSLETQNLSSHGLFVAGLAHTVAPSSTLYLVRVLEDDACGNLYSISDGIQRFMDQAITDTVKHVVINLSLGVHQPPNPRYFGLPKEVKALQKVIQNAIDTQGIEVVVVAAAGNDSYVSRSPVAMEIPASDPNVYGVAASNRNGTRGCFSNSDLTKDNWSLAAPGGNGVEGVIRISSTREKKISCAIPDCKADPRLCADSCVISLVRQPELGYAYAYWAGTSFAAPLVSGNKALRLGVAPFVGPETCPSSDPTLPNGILNLRGVEGSCSP
jgi:hypothetical protein